MNIFPRKMHIWAGCQWLTPVILAIQEPEIRRIEVQSQPWQIVLETLSWKKKFTKKRAGGVAQGKGSNLKPQYTAAPPPHRKKGCSEKPASVHIWAGHNVSWLIPALGRLRQEDGEFKASLGYKQTSKQTNKQAGSVTQEVEDLPNKHEALNSNPSIEK
jgi:hypothetical protein